MMTLSPVSSRVGTFLDLRTFILRAQVLQLYRYALQTARRAPVHSQEELRQTIREEFEKSRYIEDQPKIRYLLSEGTQRLRELNDMFDMQGYK